MAGKDSLARLERTGDRDRRELATDLVEVRARARVWKTRAIRWAGRAAGIAAAAGIALGIVRGIRRSRST